MAKPDILLALEPVVEAFEKLRVSYYLVGSIASSAYGVARATMDIDMVTDLSVPLIGELTDVLERDYYVDRDMVLEAVRKRSSFNIIHLETMIKIDVFIAEETPYSTEVSRRSRRDTLEEGEGGRAFYFASSEDVVLRKIEWFRKGGEISERQWSDVLGVIRVQGDDLDKNYLSLWAARLGISDLLTRALDDAGDYF